MKEYAKNGKMIAMKDQKMMPPFVFGSRNHGILDFSPSIARVGVRARRLGGAWHV